MKIDEIVIDIKREEGFRDMPYEDTEGYMTVGYGTKLPLSQLDATVLLRTRLIRKIEELTDELPWIKTLPEPAQQVLAQMAYQLGTGGLLRFRRMLGHLQRFEFAEAAREGLDSRWHKQTPARAERLMKRLGEIETRYSDVNQNHRRR